MKALLLKLLLIGAAVGGGAYAVRQKKVSLPFASQFKTPENVQNTVGDITENVSEQGKQLSIRTQEVSEHVQTVLGAFVQENQEASGSGDGKKALHEQAFEYGRYTYCQQVIKDYEANHQQN